jgi:hypothetical protein
MSAAMWILAAAFATLLLSRLIARSIGTGVPAAKRALVANGGACVICVFVALGAMGRLPPGGASTTSLTVMLIQSAWLMMDLVTHGSRSPGSHRRRSHD